MLDRRERNIKVFQDTEKLYQTNERLKDAVRKSIDEQKLILSDDVIVYENAGRKDGTVLVSGKRTLEAAEAYARKGKRVYPKLCICNKPRRRSCSRLFSPRGGPVQDFYLIPVPEC